MSRRFFSESNDLSSSSDLLPLAEGLRDLTIGDLKKSSPIPIPQDVMGSSLNLAEVKFSASLPSCSQQDLDNFKRDQLKNGIDINRLPDRLSPQKHRKSSARESATSEVPGAPLFELINSISNKHEKLRQDIFSAVKHYYAPITERDPKVVVTSNAGTVKKEIELDIKIGGKSHEVKAEQDNHKLEFVINGINGAMQGMRQQKRHKQLTGEQRKQLNEQIITFKRIRKYFAGTNGILIETMKNLSPKNTTRLKVDFQEKQSSESIEDYETICTYNFPPFIETATGEIVPVRGINGTPPRLPAGSGFIRKVTANPDRKAVAMVLDEDKAKKRSAKRLLDTLYNGGPRIIGNANKKAHAQSSSSSSSSTTTVQSKQEIEDEYNKEAGASGFPTLNLG